MFAEPTWAQGTLYVIDEKGNLRAFRP